MQYMIDDPLPTHGTFGDPGSNPGVDYCFSFPLNVFLFFPHA